MLSFVRRRMTFANVALTVMLVFAMSGGAFAAGKFLITSTKQISPKVLKSLQGKAGPAGAVGAQGLVGPQGPAGKDGAAGANGTNGSNGASPEGTPFSGAKAVGSVACSEGGVEYKGATTNIVCNGKKGTNGTTGFTEKLPSGKTETGSWAFAEAGTEPAGLFASISFPIPLAAEIEASKVHIFEGGTAPSGCSFEGTYLKAETGDLCIHIASGTPFEMVKATEVEAYNPEEVAHLRSAGRTGVILATPGYVKREYMGFGTWAVTAE
jgi:hypothetical protein